jgi:hypothetical protein
MSLMSSRWFLNSLVLKKRRCQNELGEFIRS